MQKPGIKTIISAAAVVIIIIIFFSVKGCGKSSGKKLVYEKITRGTVKKTISVTGELDILDPVNILSKTTGIIENVYTDFNQHVSAGQLLIKLDSTGIEQKIMKAQGLVESAKYEITTAERDLDGKRNLYKDNLISKKAMEAAEIEYNAVLNKYKQVKIDYDMTVKEREFARIHSPINGIVVAVFAKKNSPVAVSAPLILLAPTLDRMLLTISIDESDIGYIKNNQQVVFSVSAFPDRKFTGSINQVRINPVKSSGLVTYQALVLCDNTEHLLRPGMTATATVLVDEKKDVLMVPNQAFIVSPEDDTAVDDSKKIIWIKSGVLGDKDYKSVEVKTGLQGDMFTEVTDGINENDEILVRIKDKK